jgi:perosamine synthetase
MNKLLFSHARIALKYGLKLLNLNSKDIILVPDFICDAILQPMNDLSIEYNFYSLNDDLTPDWLSVKKQLKANTKAILMIHYFGYPQNIKEFQNFCTEFNLLLIEDNAHGYGGKSNGEELGTFGDIGINSPRKNLNLLSGGQLVYKGSKDVDITDTIQLLPRFKLSKSKLFLNKILNKNESLKSNLKFIIRKQPRYWWPYEFKDNKVFDQRIDLLSEQKLTEIDFDIVFEKRRALYSVWEKFIAKKGLTPVFKKFNDGNVPLVFPAYVSSEIERRGWFNWGWENRYNVHSWPTLPELVIQENRPGFLLWKKIICFPIDLKMDENLLEKKLSKL